jgi:quinohemoprotein ethanol dehydrogenase
MKIPPIALAVTLAGLLLLAGAPASGAGDAPRVPAQVNAQRLGQADREPGNWMTTGRTYSEQRFSPLDKINDSNVAQLGLAWHAKLDIDHGTEATPLVIDGVMYTTGARSIVYAFDARNGNPLWKYDPHVPAAWLGKGCCDIVNRGLAAWEGKVYVGSYDGRLIAIDARNGRKVWAVLTVDPKQPYTITGAPRVAKGKVFIGNGGSEFGSRGYVTAYDARTGKRVWRFYTVPAGPQSVKGDAAMQLAAATWQGDVAWQWRGGGNVWDSMAYDPEFNLLYIGVGNASPWNRYLRNPKGGDNLFLTAIVAIDADTGRYVWHYQTTPNEGFDYDAAVQLILADLTIDGRPRKVLMQACKNGFFYVLDRKSGELISAEPFSKVNWATRVDAKTGRPVEDPAVTDYSKEPKLIWPGPMGAHSWNPMAFDPQKGLVYIPENEAPFLYINAPDAKFVASAWNVGVALPPSPEDPAGAAQVLALFKGSLTAWDPVAQKPVWKVPYKSPGNGGVVATAGNLVFQGTADGHLVAYSANKGEKLWEADAQTGLVAAPISYLVDGEQYIAIAAGWGGGFPRFLGEIAAQNRVHTISRMLVYKLGGTATLPPLPPGPPRSTPPPLTASSASIDRGRALYTANCSVCHGGGAVSGGSTPDLRHMSLETRERFIGVVLGGLKEPGGMPNFVHRLSIEDVNAINDYLIKRAHDELAQNAAAPK